jgi:hypothetical protein
MTPQQFDQWFDKSWDDYLREKWIDIEEEQAFEKYKLELFYDMQATGEIDEE